MSENEVEAREIQIEKKDVTDEVVITDKEIEKLIDDEELEEEALAEAEEVEEEEFEERPARRLMSEDEFLERIEEFEEKNHGLTLMLDRFFKLLAKYGKKYDVELDLELWNEVAKPSLNVGFWYYQLVEGQNIMVSYPKFSLAIGVLATAFIGLGALAQIKSAKNKQKSKEELKEKAKAGIEGKKENKELKEKQIENREKIEELKANSDLLARVRKNLNSS
ncbi:hypothetical protein VFC49_09215 [Thermococcus sp. SY098]|uniref:hypothetical protein n=1 Tax=Thermococcus sp. SY098 TaxID=3111325 RepID=UPI002D78D7A1|nr:hypothetical protein [Thermococcus sp. SY098]WRS52225.1 hypothetical protein VFC49_09215 [Thermococcus sp. SY098]